MSEISTPLMNQYFKIKKEFPDEIVFFRLGDFYEMFGEDARIASRILGIALTSRGHIKGEKIPLAGIPYHALDRYLAKLIQAGKKVVICEQMEDPKIAKSIVKREVVEIITPGTVTQDNLLDRESNHYLAGWVQEKNTGGIALVDLSTGEFKIDQDEKKKLLERLSVLAPKEILLPTQKESGPELVSGLFKIFSLHTTLTFIDSWKFDYDVAFKNLTQHFKVASLDGFGCQDLKLGVCAAGAVLSYLQETKKTLLSHINRLSPLPKKNIMFLDSSTLRNLEIFSSTIPAAERPEATLFAVLNHTCTSMGARLLRNWLTRPLFNVQQIQRRQKGVKYFVENRSSRKNLQEILRQVSDLERLSGKIGTGKINPKDLLGLKESLSSVPRIKNLLKDTTVEILNDIEKSFPDTSEVIELIDKSIDPEAPAIITDRNFIKKGFNEKLDFLKDNIANSKTWIANLQATERQRLNIPSLKVGFNQVFGYYIEITKPHLDKVPQEYIRKQTLLNAERFITPELKEKEETILNAQEKIKELEQTIFNDIKEKVALRTYEIQKTGELLAVLDVLLGLASVSEENNYICPEVSDSDIIKIEDGRHPVLEKILGFGNFVPNDTALSPEEVIHIITGPNMAGKSTYLRQVGLIILLAQIGSFVPAKKAEIGIVDRIFTRVGAMDNLSLGQSTFLVEMNETANILNNATNKSLILLDEIGRGTSTFDGLSVAWSVTEWIHNKIGAKTLFATHYHELTELESLLPKVKNYQVAVKEWENEIIFLRKIIPGGCDDSYGIQVAKLAGLPEEVLARAREVLITLEQKEELEKRKEALLAKKPQAIHQTELFTSPLESELVKELEKIKIEELTPIEALNKLEELKKRIKKK